MGDAALALSDIQETWITTEAAAGLLGVSDRTIRRSLNQYTSRQIPRAGAGGDRFEVLLASLPARAIEAWQARSSLQVRELDAQGELFQAYQRANQQTRRHFDRWSRILLATKALSGRRALEEWVSEWNRMNPEEQISTGSLYRVRSQVEEMGLEGLLLRRTRLPESTVRDDWFQAFADAYLNENRLSMEVAREVALGAAMRQAQAHGRQIDLAEFPSMHAFRRRLEREFSPAVIEFKRRGEKRFYDRFGYYIEREYSDLVAGRIWVGDSRVLDILVRGEASPSPVRPWVTAFICMKSYVPMGWHIHLSAPSAENTMRALHHGILRVGKPEWWYLDHGREYQNSEVTGISRGSVVNYDKQHTGSIAALLGIQVHFAEVKNARAKPIERQFQEMKNKFDRFWITFKGGNALEKPDRLKGILQRPSQIPDFDEVRESLSHWYEAVFPRFRCQGKTHRGRSRADVFEQDIALHGPLPAVSSDTAAMLVTKMARGRIGRRGFHLAALDATWWGEWMTRENGNEVVLRYDPQDLRLAWAYEATETGHGPLIDTCDLIEATGAKVSPDDAFGMSQIREGQRIRKSQLKALRVLQPQATADGLRRMREDFELGIGARAIELAPGDEVIQTQHDITSARVRREQRAGRFDLAPFDQPQEPTRELLWYEGQTAAG